MMNTLKWKLLYDVGIRIYKIAYTVLFIRNNIHFQWLWIFNISLSMNSKNVENEVNEPKQYEMVVWTQNGISCGHSDMSLDQLSQR